MTRMAKRSRTEPAEKPAVRFERLWKQHDGPVLVREWRFYPPRRWRLDYFQPHTFVGIEIEGGTWVRGRHTRPGGYSKDCEKYNTAAMAGLRVLRLTSDMVSDEWVERIIRYCRSLGGDGLCGGDILTFAGGEGPDCGENGDELLVSDRKSVV